MDLQKMILSNPRDGVQQKINERIMQEMINDDFVNMVKKNMEPWRRLMSCYRCAIMEVETKFRVLNEEFSLQYDRNPIENIKTRLKTMESIAGKMKRKGLPVNLTSLEENIFDVAGVRVICSFPEDIYMLEECFLKQDDVRLIERKDYIQNAKPSGYRSLHLIVETPIFLENEKRMMKVEVQLRTIAMDFWASLDHKLQYKKNISEDMQESLKAQLLECANISADLDKRMEAIRNQLEEAQSECKP
jgi:putative GTP pyrophosphokinase